MTAGHTCPCPLVPRAHLGQEIPGGASLLCTYPDTRGKDSSPGARDPTRSTVHEGSGQRPAVPRTRLPSWAELRADQEPSAQLALPAQLWGNFFLHRQQVPGVQNSNSATDINNFKQSFRKTNGSIWASRFLPEAFPACLYVPRPPATSELGG